MSRSVIRARLNATGQGTVFIDDKDVSSLVSEMIIKSSAGGITTVALRLIAVETDLEIEGELHLSEEGKPCTSP